MPWRGAFGLRGRIVGAVIVTTVATLVVAAVALLGPLEHSLRKASVTTLTNELSHGAVMPFQNHPLSFVLDASSSPTDPHQAEGHDQLGQLRQEEIKLGQQIGATVVVAGYPTAD